MLARALTQCFVLLFLAAPLAMSRATTYVVLWFDTEDYVDPIADDAALRIANDLTAQGVRATFKVVGEKARVLEARGRLDVINALGRHTIGYHSNWHSIQPVPALALQHLGLLEGADEFERMQRPGLEDLERIFGVRPICYGQPGSSYAPQSNLALRRMGVPVYLDGGTQVGFGEQPIWYGGLLYVYNVGRYQLRAPLDHEGTEEQAFREFDDAANALAAKGGGLISIYYHPTEFVHTEFWDAANFAHGASRPRNQWVPPKRRTHEEAERCFGILHRYVAHAKQTPDVVFITANDLLRVYANPMAPQVKKQELAQHFAQGIDFLSTSSGDLSAADILLELLNMPVRYVDGPAADGRTNLTEEVIPDYLYEEAVESVKAFIEKNARLPNEVFVGSKTLSLGDFAATLAAHVLTPGPVHVKTGQIRLDKYFATDARASFNWPIHPEGFAPEELMALARLQGWTLKPARLR